MERRRVVFKIGVTYETTLEQLQAIPSIIKNISKYLAEKSPQIMTKESSE